MLFIDAVCATAAAAVTTICEGVTMAMARDKPVVAASMYVVQQVAPCCNLCSTESSKLTMHTLHNNIVCLRQVFCVPAAVAKLAWGIPEGCNLVFFVAR